MKLVMRAFLGESWKMILVNDVFRRRGMARSMQLPVDALLVQSISTAKGQHPEIWNLECW